MQKISWGIFLIITFAITLPASWWVLAKAGFGYSVLYDTIGIPVHISLYAPKNYKNKKNFELTTKTERVDLFQNIVEEIQTDGSGLKKLTYQDKINKKTITLFTEAEVIHLQDVNNLLNSLKMGSLFLLIFWITMVFILWQRKIRLASSKQLFISGFTITILLGLVLLLGPDKIFNQLHVWIFPDNHQWFFYYEESLMSTLMKAPDIFAYIAGMWFLLSMVFTILIVRFIRVFLN